MPDFPIHIDEDTLKAGLARRYSISLDAVWSPIFNGDECLVWKMADTAGAFVIRVSPSWRSIAELEWVHELVAHCATLISQAIAPIPANDGTSLFVVDDCPVTVFPFVEGSTVNDTNAAVADEAARLLARIHRSTQLWPGKRPRPGSKVSRSRRLSRKALPAEFGDSDFAAWETSLAQRNLTIGPIHGDYYPRNLIAFDSVITGVIDWDEADNDWLMAETAWAAWEFCQDERGDDLDVVKAETFLAAYFDENPPCPRAEAGDAINFIRLRLRNEVAANFARRTRGENWSQEDEEYAASEIRAFVSLRGKTLG